MSNIGTNEGTAEQMLATVTTGGIALWNDDKKKDFVTTFQQRLLASRYVLVKTAEQIRVVAQEKQYISAKHTGDIKNVKTTRDIRDKEVYLDHRGCEQTRVSYTMAGGRDVSQLDQIALARAEAVLAELPPLKQALVVIAPETAAQLAQVEKLEKEGQKLVDRLNEVTQVIDLKELDQTTTLAQLHQMIEQRDDERAVLIRKIEKISEQGASVQKMVAKKLYGGLPGLSDAVVAVINEHYDRSLAMDAMGRRVEEQVMFGDSDSALELLRGFEQDEITVSDSVKAQFSAAMETLRNSVKKAKKVK